MTLYESIVSFLSTLGRLADRSATGQLISEWPDRAWDFWTTDATVAQGISYAQIAAAAVSALFVFVIATSVVRRRALMAQKPAEATPAAEGEMPPAPARGALAARWAQVLKHLEAPQEAEWKIAVIEADKLVDDALARAGFPGESFGDRLTNIEPGALTSLDGVWWAHKIRNRLAHETDYFLRYTEARQALAYYEQALAELQLI